ncbi:bacteriocin immunity protein [Chthoniobacter flavus]|uniref:bacteriocin immunity protein n=1 Tax=Chthoniobacter flavus TaxID=191863 RepID=UPI0005B2ABB8|nr:bacteriocin immunity protein [Chthoniobacter flavus]
MKTPAIEDVLRPLRVARRRLGVQFFLVALVKAGLLAGAGLLIFGAVNRWLLERLPWNAQVTGYVIVAAVLLALLVTLARRRDLVETAGVLDRLGGTHDRFLTALTFYSAAEADPMHELAVQECTRFVRAGKFSGLIRIRMPRQVVYLLVPVLAIALLQWETQHTFAVREADKIAARAAVEDTAKRLEQLAKETAKASEENKADALKKLAEQLQKGAEQLRANATNPEEAGKSKLRELSALEQMVQDMQKSPAGLTPEEQQALAKALEQNEATKEAAKSLAAGDQAKAAEELEKEMQKLAEQKDGATSEEIRKQLEDAVKQLAQQKQLSEAMQKLAQQLKESGAKQGGNSSEAAKALAQMLRQMAQGKSGQQSGGQQSEQRLQNLLAALQNMKAGEGQSQESKEPQSGQPGAGVKMQSFAESNPDGVPNPGDPNLPSGHPGGEHDLGTTDSVFGKDQNAAGKEGEKKLLSAGRMGDGESMQQSLQSAGDHSKSNRGYKKLYEAMAPAAEDAVLQENIPLGSRFFIKRYFESIRPKE